MKFSFIGGGAWGATLAQVLLDNQHEVMVYEKNETHRKSLKAFKHPFFNVTLPQGLNVTDSLKEALSFSNDIVIAIPTKFIFQLTDELEQYDISNKTFINVSKGFILPSLLTVSQRFEEKLPLMKAFVSLTGPSHAEEVIDRHLTTLVAASKNESEALRIANAFNNHYMRIYTSLDTIGCEVGGAVKNAIAVASGILTSLGYGENARAALLTRGLLEIKAVVESFHGDPSSVYGLTGIGDLMVTALSMNSRNFKAGLKIGQGMTRFQIEAHEKQTIEGFNTIEALYQLIMKHNLDLPIIKVCYKIIFLEENIDDLASEILNHTVKTEKKR
jgi:glycerol-3-phosphate dehydrogenase (NAD(P)+)